MNTKFLISPNIQSMFRFLHLLKNRLFLTFLVVNLFQWSSSKVPVLHLLFPFTFNLCLLSSTSPLLFFFCNLFWRSQNIILKFLTFRVLSIAFLCCHLTCPWVLVRNRSWAKAWIGEGDKTTIQVAFWYEVV